MRPLATRFIAGIGFLALPAMAQAQTLTVNGLVDLGLSMPSATNSWMKGGFGKLDDGGSGRTSIAPVGQGLTDLHLELDPSLGLFATARFAPDQHAPFDVLEAYARYQPVSTPNWLLSIKLGTFFAPISLENEGVGWTSPWTLTPSAINSWVGDELRTIGGETSAEWRYQGGALGLTGAVFGWNDPAGALLAERGWAFDSRPIGLLGEPRLPNDFVGQIPLREEPFKEIGGQPGWYAGASLRQDDLGRVNVLYYDNRADPAAFIGSDFGWRTKFTSLGVDSGIGDVVLLAQAMAGTTEIDPVPAFRAVTDFQAAYLLAGYYFGDFRIAGRVDVFATQVQNMPGGNGPGEHGRALTLSGSWTPVRWLRLITEVIHVDSYTGQRASVGLRPQASESQVQFVTRIAF
jgi:hypothetical protein